MGRLVLGQLSVTLSDLEAQARGAASPEDVIQVPGVGGAPVGDVLYLGGVRNWIQAHIAAGNAYDADVVGQLLNPPAVVAPAGSVAPPTPGIVPEPSWTTRQISVAGARIPILYLVGGGAALIVLMLAKKR